jgi:hypothetical protein
MSVNKLDAQIVEEIAKETNLRLEQVATVIRMDMEAALSEVVPFMQIVGKIEKIAKQTNLSTHQVATILSKYTWKHPELRRKHQQTIAAHFENER